MTFTLELPDLSAVPSWVWTVGCVLLWYSVAALIARLTWARGQASCGEVTCSRLMFWFGSPAVLLIGLAWVLLWAVSFGLVPFPRRRRSDDDEPSVLGILSAFLTFPGLLFMICWAVTGNVPW